MTDELDSVQLGNDVIETVNALMDVVDASASEQQSPLGIEPEELVEMFKPQLYQKVQRKPERTLCALAILNQATTDIIDKHASDSDVQALAARGMQPEE